MLKKVLNKMRIFFQIILDEVARNCVDIATDKLDVQLFKNALTIVEEQLYSC
jgi:hypothetical protein